MLKPKFDCQFELSLDGELRCVTPKSLCKKKRRKGHITDYCFTSEIEFAPPALLQKLDIDILAAMAGDGLRVASIDSPFLFIRPGCEVRMHKNILVCTSNEEDCFKESSKRILLKGCLMSTARYECERCGEVNYNPTSRVVVHE